MNGLGAVLLHTVVLGQAIRGWPKFAPGFGRVSLGNGKAEEINAATRTPVVGEAFLSADVPSATFPVDIGNSAELR